jgi:antitoxin component YwqK of YwqJK toxin-antitoxin module
MKNWLILLLLVLSGNTIWAQSKGCDQLIQRGDTTVCQDFTSKGRLFREHFYVKGERVFTRWWHYRKNGDYESTQHQKKSPFAKKHGPAVQYYKNGQVKRIGRFQNNKLVGRCFSYYLSGKMKSACNHNEKGDHDGLVTDFYENGQVMHQARWSNGLLVEILANKDEQGKDIPFGTFKDGTGTWIFQEPETEKVRVYYFKNGRLTKSTTFQHQ